MLLGIQPGIGPCFGARIRATLGQQRSEIKSGIRTAELAPIRCCFVLGRTSVLALVLGSATALRCNSRPALIFGLGKQQQWTGSKGEGVSSGPAFISVKHTSLL